VEGIAFTLVNVIFEAKFDRGILFKKTIQNIVLYRKNIDKKYGLALTKIT